METFEKIAELRLAIQARQSKDKKTRIIVVSLAIVEFFLSMTLLALVKW